MTHRYLHGPAVDQVFADEDALGEILWGLPDNQGTVRDVVDYDAVSDTTAIANHRVFTAFGELTSEQSTEFRYFYTGRYLDPDTGLQNNGARWYDATIGRWISEDPIGFAAGDANLVRYVGNSPTNAIDPSGLYPIVLEKYNGRTLKYKPPAWLPDWLKPFTKPDPSDFISPLSMVAKEAKAASGLKGVLKGIFKSKTAAEFAEPVMKPCAKAAEKQTLRQTLGKIIAENKAAHAVGKDAEEILRIQKELSQVANRQAEVIDKWLKVDKGRLAKTYRKYKASKCVRDQNFAKLIRGRVLHHRMNNLFRRHIGDFPGIRWDRTIPGSGSPLRPDLYFRNLGGRRIIFEFGGPSKIGNLGKYKGLADEVIPVIPPIWIPKAAKKSLSRF